jgi:hypothetical protein
MPNPADLQHTSKIYLHPGYPFGKSEIENSLLGRVRICHDFSI